MSNDDQRAEEIDVEEQETLADKLLTDFRADVLAGCYDCDCAECQGWVQSEPDNDGGVA